MTSIKKTKRALLGSVICMILCLSMLIGTTFAWFTDSVVSGKNHIVAGNLDVELEYLVNGKWVAVDGDTNIFGDSKWEPGHVEAVTMRVSNAGTLALKYQMGINVVSEQTSINVNGEELKLSDYIEYGIVDGEYASREAAKAAVTNPTKLSQGYNEDKVELLPGESKELTLVAYMDESVGNEANHKPGAAAPEIYLGINLMATQLVHENDSFGNDYDKDAIFGGIPSATVTKLSNIPDVPLTNIESLQQTGENISLDVAYEFATTQSFDQAGENKYAKYHADFVVSFDKDVKAESIALGGYYEYWCAANNNDQWLAFALPMDIQAGEKYRLLDAAGITINYEELCLLVKEFLCGAANLSAANVGTTMTVELRIYEVAEPDWNTGNSWNNETGVSECFGTYSYTFGNPASVPVPEIKENANFVNTDLTWWDQSPLKDIQLDTAYTFSSNETEPGSYEYWDADFYVSIDRDVAAGDLMLAGQYDAWNDGWVGFEMPATSANEAVGLLTTAGINVKYWEVLDIIKEFNCGVADMSDALAGATITVQLVLSNGAESYVVSTNTYTF